MELSLYILNITIILANVVLVQVVGRLCLTERSNPITLKKFIYFATATGCRVGCDGPFGGAVRARFYNGSGLEKSVQPATDQIQASGRLGLLTGRA